MVQLTASRTSLWISFGLSALVVLFLLADAGVSIFAPHLLADAQAQVGFPPELSPLLGGIMALCALVFAIPRTATIGAILITAFAGGPSARMSGSESSDHRPNSSRSPWRRLPG
jgi:DoxX-like family